MPRFTDSTVQIIRFGLKGFNADKSTAPTVVGSHMSLLRPTTPRLSGDRRNGKPGEVSTIANAVLPQALNDALGLRSLRDQR